MRRAALAILLRVQETCLLSCLHMLFVLLSAFLCVTHDVTHAGVKVYVDPKAVMYLVGSRMDFVVSAAESIILVYHTFSFFLVSSADLI